MKKWWIQAALCGCMAQAALAAPPQTLAHEQFEQQVKVALAPLAGQAITGLKVLHLSADLGPWLDTGLALQPGEPVTVLMQGQAWLSRQYQLSLQPSLQVWHRIGSQGTIARSLRNTDSFVAAQAGTLQFKNLPTRWLNPQGDYRGEPAALNPDAGGGVEIVVIRWEAGTDVAAELGKLAARDGAPALIKDELARLAAPAAQAPEGWKHLWELGPSTIFKTVAAAPDGGPEGQRLSVHTHDDVAILQKDVALAMTPDTRLQWAWKIDALPALGPENLLPAHDYLSIAVEFDNGQDLTYLWSRELPVGLGFRCPIEGWKDRETHIVARTGSADLHRWLNESVNVWDDYRQAVGGPMPRRITRVWIIANSIFGHQAGSAMFSDIRLGNGAQDLKVW